MEPAQPSQPQSTPPTPEPQPQTPLPHPAQLASLVLEQFEKEKSISHERKIRVNPVVAKFATWFEKLRNAMEYREDEVILRAAVERILRRRLLLGGNAQTTAEPLIRELIWARYLQDNMVPESMVGIVEEIIHNFLELRLKVLSQRVIPEAEINEWTYQLMSANLEDILNPKLEKETIANFMYQILKDHIEIVDDTEETKNAQVYIAVRKAFARDDIAFLRYNLFKLYFGELTKHNLDQVARDFGKGYKEIVYELNYPRKDKIHAYVKKKAAAFFILEDICINHKKNLQDLLKYEESFKDVVFATCEVRYKSISSKIRRAIVRSVIFILLTKVIFAFAVEGTYERIVYGRILWGSIILNTSFPPLLMIIVSLFIRAPGKDNSERIYSYIRRVLFDEQPRIGNPLRITKVPEKRNPALQAVFGFLWMVAFVLSFGSIIAILSQLEFSLVSQGIFVFFLAIVSFLAYRISLASRIYTVGDKQNSLTPIVDFFFMPVVRVGRKLTQSISSINVLLFLFDFIIETPFKLVFAFFEQWFRFLHEKSEEIS